MPTPIDKNSFLSFLSTKPHVLWLILIAITLLFSFFLNPNLIIKTQSYNLGDVAQKDVKAPKDFFIEDTAATEENRKQAIESVITVYDHDTAMVPDLISRIFHSFKEMRTILLSDKNISEENELSSDIENMNPKSDQELKTIFEEIIGISCSDGAFSILKKENFSLEVSNLIIEILSKVLKNGVVTNKEILLKESEKGIILKAVGSNEEQILENLKRIYGLDQAKTMVRIIGQPLLKDINYNLKNLVVDFVQRLIQPNITLNKSETENRIKAAETEVKPVLYMIKKGEMLLREGERVTMPQLIKLKSLETQTEKKNIVTKSIGTALIIICFLIIIYFLFNPNLKKVDQNLNKNIFFISCILIVYLFIAKILAFLPESSAPGLKMSLSASSISYGIPLASAAMTICLFLGLEAALPFSLLLSVFTSIIFLNRFEIFIFFFLSCSMAAYWIQDCRERKVFVKAGLKISLLNLILVMAINIYLGDITSDRLLWDCVFAITGGILSGIMTSGITPIVEIIFNYTTDIKLLELANLDQPILRRLMLEAPGTYNHSVIVGTMAEAAAAEINANSLLARVCGYYHDIGKIKKPLYFIENQAPGKNKHDKLAPSMSALIITAHVKDGVEIAKKEKLGQPIIDTIRQHHGSSLLSYFFGKAKQMAGEEQTVTSEEYKYPGPKPQTRETGIVMLADVVEAASRTLENPTSSRIQGLVQNLINKIFIDGQLEECELTLKDLHSIAKSFNKILNGIYHHRIEYAESSSQGDEKKDKDIDEHSDRQQAEKPKDSNEKVREEDPGHIKRLGIS